MNAAATTPIGAEERERCTELLFREARLLDRVKLREWLELLDDEVVYWVPLNEEYADPEAELNIIYDDRRRLGVRVDRLEGGDAISQMPPSRTARLVGNITIARSDGGYATESTFVLYELRSGDNQLLAGRYFHELVERDGELKIRRKTVELVTRTEPLFNVTFLL